MVNGAFVLFQHDKGLRKIGAHQREFWIAGESCAVFFDGSCVILAAMQDQAFDVKCAIGGMWPLQGEVLQQLFRQLVFAGFAEHDEHAHLLGFGHRLESRDLLLRQ